MRDERNKSEEILAELEDPNLREALRGFKSSVNAWSDAAYSSARTAPARGAASVRRSLAWALSLVLSAGAISGAVYDRHHQQVVAERQHQQELQLEHEQQLAALQLKHKESEDLLAKIDSDISREVPSAMEPLAQMMTDDSGSQ